MLELPVQGGGEPVEGTVLAPVDGVTFDVEVIGDHRHLLVLCPLAEEEPFEDVPVVFSDDFPRGQEPVHVLACLQVASLVRTDPLNARHDPVLARVEVTRGWCSVHTRGGWAGSISLSSLVPGLNICACFEFSCVRETTLDAFAVVLKPVRHQQRRAINCLVDVFECVELPVMNQSPFAVCGVDRTRGHL